MLLSGKVFDSTLPDVVKKAGLQKSPSGNPRVQIVGSGIYTRGFDDALMLLPKGAKATVIVPSMLAFGELNEGVIQPYTPLVFEIEMIDFKSSIPGPISPANASPVKTSATTVGAAMPQFKLYKTDGTSFTQNDIKGNSKSIYIYFDTSCDHCQHELAAVNKQYADFKNVNFYLVSINDKAAIIDFVRTYGSELYTGKNVTILQDKEQQFQFKFQPVEFPSLYVYSESKKLIGYFAGQKNINDIVKAAKSH